jgi:hypothetical protein
VGIEVIAAVSVARPLRAGSTVATAGPA